MNDLTPIIQQEEDEEGVEILPPIKRPSVSMMVAPSPDIGPALTELRDRLQDVLGIPSQDWPVDRQVVLEVQFTIAPSAIKATVTNIAKP